MLSPDAVAEHGLTGAADNEHDFFKQVFLRLESLSRGNFAEIRVVGRVITEQVDECPQTSHSLPGLQLGRSDILDVESPKNRDPLRFNPLVVHAFFHYLRTLLYFHR